MKSTVASRTRPVKKSSASSSALWRAYRSASVAERKMTALLLNEAFCSELTASAPEAWTSFRALRAALSDRRQKAFAAWLASE